jgi:hypothetical protein
MNTIPISVLKGAAVVLLIAIPLWWLPVFLQRAIPDFWLAAMTVPPVMLGGYVAARHAPRPILCGVLTGLVAMSLILTVSLTAEELWAVPIMILIGGIFAALGAHVAFSAGHTAARK